MCVRVVRWWGEGEGSRFSQVHLEEERNENFCLIFLQLSKATSLLNEAQQPYNYLIESIKARDTQNQTLTERLELMEEDVRSVKYQ